jgi:hypothetical protein
MIPLIYIIPRGGQLLVAKSYFLIVSTFNRSRLKNVLIRHCSLVDSVSALYLGGPSFKFCPRHQFTGQFFCDFPQFFQASAKILP